MHLTDTSELWTLTLQCISPQVSLLFETTLSSDDFKILNHLFFGAAVIHLCHTSPTFQIPSDGGTAKEPMPQLWAVGRHEHCWKGHTVNPRVCHNRKRKAAKMYALGSGATKEDATWLANWDASSPCPYSSTALSLVYILPLTPITGPFFLERHFCPITRLLGRP